MYSPNGSSMVQDQKWNKIWPNKDNDGVVSFTPPKYPSVTEKDGKLFKVNSYWLNSPRLSKNFLKRQMNNNDNKDEYTAWFAISRSLLKISVVNISVKNVQLDLYAYT